MRNCLYIQFVWVFGRDGVPYRTVLDLEDSSRTKICGLGLGLKHSVLVHDSWNWNETGSDWLMSEDEILAGLPNISSYNSTLVLGYHP